MDIDKIIETEADWDMRIDTSKSDAATRKLLDMYRKSYSGNLDKHRRQTLASAVCYALAAALLLAAVAIMLLKIFGVIGDTACNASLIAAGVLFVADSIVCKYMGRKAKRSYFAAVRCDNLARSILDEGHKCQLCGMHSDVLHEGPSGTMVCDGCLKLPLEALTKTYAD